MTFTEAAVEVLRQAGKPLHYKKITELAIEQNLLSHVGKTPETTMSSRLSTMVKKDRGDAPITKVKPGVFALRDGAGASDADEADEELPQSADDEAGAEETVEATTDAGDDTEEAAEPPPQLPGADVFPEEEDDDELILANLDSDNDDRGRARRRRGGGRRRRADDEEQSARSRDSGRRERGGRRGGREQTRGSSRRRQHQFEGDWNRRAENDEPAGEELAYAIAKALKAGRRERTTLRRVAERLVSNGRLSGRAEALLPTLAAAIRGDDARRAAEGLRPRFRLLGDEIALTDWALPSEAIRAENDVLKSAKRQRDAIRRALIRRLRDMPDAALLELIATWLNARGVTAIRGVRATDSGFNLAGVLRRGPEELPLAIVVYRANVERDHVIDVRGALHHFGQAKVAWLVTLGRVDGGAKEEASAEGAAPCALYDGDALAESLEEAGVGIRAVHVPIATLDLDLLETLEGPQSAREGRADEEEVEREEGSNGRRRRSSRKRGRRRAGADKGAQAAEAAPADGDSEGESTGEEGGERLDAEAGPESAEGSDATTDSGDQGAPDETEASASENDPVSGLSDEAIDLTPEMKGA